jgi:hypothetical protein
MLVAGLALCVSCERTTASGDERAEPSDRQEPRVSAASSGYRDGDLIFQESTSRQSEMVRVLTDSRWTHLGVIFHEQAGPIVLEASSPVKKTPLQRWIDRGQGRRFVVKRLEDVEARLPPEVIERMRKLGATWLGRPYDARFRWDDQSLYCSELAYKLFDLGAGVRLGKLERAADMNLDDERVRQALRKRFAGAKFEPDEIVVTPDSIFNDEQLVEVGP